MKYFNDNNSYHDLNYNNKLNISMKIIYYDELNILMITILIMT